MTTRVGEHRESLSQRVRVLVGAFWGALALVASGYFLLQVIDGPRFRELAENNRLRRVPIEAPRGAIYDRTGRVLVEDLPSYNLYLDRSRATSTPASLTFAARTLGRPVAELEHLLERYRTSPSHQPALLAEGLSLSEVARFEVERLEHPEFDVEVTQRRFYRLGTYAAHVLGYLGEVDAADLARPDSPYRAGEWIGRRGIERAYEPQLRGLSGERVVVVDSRGLQVEEYGRRLGRPGSDLHLTLDAALQSEAERQLTDKVGAIVALDPRDGAVRALVSSPAYDPNLFARKLAAEDWRALVEDPHHPLQNRALSSAYSPGSVFKVVVAAAGLAEGIVTPSTTEYCPGAANYYGRTFHCWRPGGHGRMDLESAIQNSCDVYFYALGQKLGIERIARYARMFDLGRPTGIDLGGERSGLVPDEAWSEKARRHPWYPGETISVAIGQGALLVTPLQMATMMAAIANGGLLVRPHVAENTALPPPQRLPLSAAVLDPIRRGLWRVVNAPGGTGAVARVPGLEIAGKTGTTQVASQEAYSDSSKLPWELRNHAWFASYAPAASPELVIVVFIEHGGKGSGAAAPVARALMERYFGSLPDTVTAAS